MARPKKLVEAFEPAKFFVLNDISLWDTSLVRENDYEPGRHQGKCTIQAFQSVKPEFCEVVIGSGPESLEEETRPMLRVLVALGVRSICKEEGRDDEILYSLEATFAVDYFVIEPPEPAALEDFVKFNCVHNAWPFWRQHVFDIFKRASLPVPTVPFFPGRAGRKKHRISKIRKLSVDFDAAQNS